MNTNQMNFKPFQDSTTSSMIDQLTLENQGNRISIYGSLQITCDQQGLAYAEQLVDILNQSIQYLKNQHLPEKIADDSETTEVKNPFL